jgi:hypothetical protein
LTDQTDSPTGQYSIKRLLKQEPAVIVSIFGQVLSTTTLLGWMPILSDKAAFAVTTLLNLILTAAYIRPSTTSKDALKEVNDAQLQAIQLGKQLVRPPLEH